MRDQAREKYTEAARMDLSAADRAEVVDGWRRSVEGLETGCCNVWKPPSGDGPVSTLSGHLAGMSVSRLITAATRNHGI